MIHVFGLVAAVFGSVVTLWLAWSLLRDAKRQQTPRYQAHTWLVDERHDAKDSMSAIRAAHLRMQRDLHDAGYRGLVSDAKKVDGR